ncbi:MAG: hypothetical protein RLZZ505_2266 [Verrucomicrobiota bacterium]
MIAMIAFAPLCVAEEPKFTWEPLNIKTSLFSANLLMLDSERDEYATNLASHAANMIAKDGASMASIKQGRRILALALHLSPRNKQALVTQFQLAKGIVPEKTDGDYSPQVLARLLLTRGQLLLQQQEGENRTLARYLIQLAAEIDPRNEDAVYASELIRLDTGTPDWTPLTDGGTEKKEELP